MRRWWRVVGEVILAIMLAPFVEACLLSLRLRGPGAIAILLLAGVRSKLDLETDIWVTLAIIVGVDAAFCFGLIWGGRLLRARMRRKANGKHLEARR